MHDTLTTDRWGINNDTVALLCVKRVLIHNTKFGNNSYKTSQLSDYHTSLAQWLRKYLVTSWMVIAGNIFIMVHSSCMYQADLLWSYQWKYLLISGS